MSIIEYVIIPLLVLIVVLIYGMIANKSIIKNLENKANSVQEEIKETKTRCSNNNDIEIGSKEYWLSLLGRTGIKWSSHLWIDNTYRNADKLSIYMYILNLREDNISSSWELIEKFREKVRYTSLWVFINRDGNCKIVLEEYLNKYKLVAYITPDIDHIQLESKIHYFINEYLESL